MSSQEILGYLFVWGLVGAVVFSLYVVIVFRTGVVYNSRRQDGILKEKQDWRGVLSSLSILLLIVILQLLSNYTLIVVQGVIINFFTLLLINYLLYLLLFLYDTFVIDYFVIARWRPAFLKLPDEMNVRSMAEHIKASLIIGPIIGCVVILVGALLSYYVFM